MKNPYEVLGVSKNAEDQEIKRAYKEFAKKYHPDRNPGDAKAEERFKEAKNAYEQIKDAKARQEYEQEQTARNFGRQGFQGGDPGPFSSGGFRFSSADVDEDILNEIFGGLGGAGGFSGFSSGGFSGGYSGDKRRPGTPKHESASVDLDFWDAAAGGERIVNLPDGTRLQVNIPAGIKTGQKIRLKGQASKLNPRSGGDLLLEARVKEDKKAWREGDNVVVEHDLPVDEAVKGGESAVNTPLGNFTLKIPPYTDSGKKFRLKGKGPRGADLLVKINLVLPQERKEEISKFFTGGAAA